MRDDNGKARERNFNGRGMHGPRGWVTTQQCNRKKKGLDDPRERSFVRRVTNHWEGKKKNPPSPSIYKRNEERSAT